jgi:3-oxosteroid 1-dehydrogenase
VPESRSLEPVPFNGRLLGDELSRLRRPMAEAPLGIAFTGSDYQKIAMFISTWQGKKAALRAGLDWAGNLLRGVKLLTMGQALSGRLRYALMQAGIPLWMETAFESLIIEDGRVTGAVVRRRGQEMRIRARRGVLLAAGGFPASQRMRERYLPAPTSSGWTVACPGNTGDALRAGIEAGAATDLLDDAWWGPVSRAPGEDAFFHVGERAFPGAILVNGVGRRFVNESAPYIDVVHRIYAEHSPQSPHIPAWFIFDRRWRSRYIFRTFFPMTPIPRRYFENGYIQRAGTMADLAAKIGVDAETLCETVATGRNGQRRRSGTCLPGGTGPSCRWSFREGEASR